MSYRVLLCDDENHILRAAEFKLSRAGYTVVCANDGKRPGRNSIADSRCTDYRLSNAADGWCGIVHKIRENAATKSLPILMLTAKGYELLATN